MRMKTTCIYAIVYCVYGSRGRHVKRLSCDAAQPRRLPWGKLRCRLSYIVYCVSPCTYIYIFIYMYAYINGKNGFYVCSVYSRTVCVRYGLRIVFHSRTIIINA